MENIQSAERLEEGLAFHDSFGAVPDDRPIYVMDENDCLFEFAYEGGSLKLGDLRNLLQLLKDQGLL